ncbi:MAG: nucleotidyltransferase domain-containing protein [Nitrososphaeria archaeon]
MFGSIVKGRYTASSDIDVLVVLQKSPSKDKEYEVKAEVYMSTEAPIELHIASVEKFERWYKRFIKEEELFEV